MLKQKSTEVKDMLFLRLIAEMALDTQNVFREWADLNQNTLESLVSDNVNDAILLFEYLINIIKTKKISLLQATKIHWFAMQYISEAKPKLENDDEFLKCVYVRIWIEKHFEITHENFPAITWLEEE
jgi:hypothetical protein